MRDALSILERCSQEGTDEIDENKVKDLVGIPKTVFINNIVEAIVNEDVEGALDNLQEVIKDGKDINNLVWEIIKYIKDVLLYKSTGKTELYNEEEIEKIKNIADKTSKLDLINLICELSEIENNMKLSTQKLIILQTGLIKLCNKQPVKTNVNIDENNANTQNSDLERRVTKIENFLRAGNFAKAGLKQNTVNTVQKNKENPSNVETNNIKTVKPKYQGKTQDYWPKIVEDYKTSGKMFMYMNLAGTVAREINDMTLEVEFPKGMNEVAKDFLARPDIKQNLRETIHLACGKEMQIKFVDTKEISKTNSNEFEQFIERNNIPFNII